MNADLHQRITDLVNSHKFVLFMKGTRQRPTCGFSAQVVQALDELLQDYNTVNVLEDQEIRDGIKQYANWPTIPQLFVDGELVGGCDVVGELRDNDRLREVLGLAPDSPPPTVPNEIDLSKACRCGGSRAKAQDQSRLSTSDG